mgnify:CR=1
MEYLLDIAMASGALFVPVMASFCTAGLSGWILNKLKMTGFVADVLIVIAALTVLFMGLAYIPH